MSETQVQLSIPYPPNHIFKYRKNVVRPATEVMQQENSMFIFKNVEYTDQGIFAYFQDVPYPSKGHPFPEALYAINAVKRIILNLLRIFSTREMMISLLGFIFLPKKRKIKLIEKSIEGFKECIDMIMRPYYLEDHYYSRLPKQIRLFITKFLTCLGVSEIYADSFAEIIASAFQWDNAYYLRLADTMSETTKEKMLADPRGEISRILEITNGRDSGDFMSNKNRSIAKILRLILLVPSIKRAFKEAIKVGNFEDWQMDEADKYHVLLWADYKFGGKTLDERVEEYKAFHKGVYPQRVTYKPNHA